MAAKITQNPRIRQDQFRIRERLRWSFLNFQEQNETDAEGKFVFPKLRPGKWHVRLLPVDRRGQPVGGKTVELKPGQTTTVTFGGEGRSVVGRILWSSKNPPENGDPSKISIGVQADRPELPEPPKEIADQGPDAVDAWLKQWQESAEGQAWIEQYKRHWRTGRAGTVASDSSFRIEGVEPGRYQLSVVVQLTDGLPWERPNLLRYNNALAMPEIPGGVSDEPFDLGDVPLDMPYKETPAPSSLGRVRPPAPQAPGEKTVGPVRENLDLLHYLTAAYAENKAKIQSWQGRAIVENRSENKKDERTEEYSATVQFALDLSRKSIRWNTTMDRRKVVVRGQEEPQPAGQIIAGMIMPDGLYRVGNHGSPADPAKRPLTLTITPLRFPGDGLNPRQFDFNPLYYLDVPNNDLAQMISSRISVAERTASGSVSLAVSGGGRENKLDVTLQAGCAEHTVTRESNMVTLVIRGPMSSTRITLDIDQGCNPVAYESRFQDSHPKLSLDLREPGRHLAPEDLERDPPRGKPQGDIHRKHRQPAGRCRGVFASPWASAAATACKTSGRNRPRRISTRKNELAWIAK